MQSNEALLIKTLLARSCPSARLSRVQRVQNKKLWRAHCRDELNGLDPRFSKGGFYGQGIYLAEDPSYPIGGRPPSARGDEGDAHADVRIEGPPRLLYDSVRGGPHRPFVSGGGENGCDASIVHVVYESRQMYPAYVIEVRAMGVAAAVAALRAHASVSRVALVACGRLAELCLEAQNRQPAADTGAM
ncbi:hypothetical protein EMIHUDRAFT_202897 [Emiliania huxleyi CCMP1516]|uniref:Poly [ADP-ribose] polymerase n=2 Tax=Emiliania huxleyi TaxID=2903 RepID=A0A0D3K905_EMIH1|nr:hypothetical protein EMIHUDRAFT_202897 [Emiliania huxleyi CCMP1516]EOD32240.1 hypothetical protein EMIHUDRAFT_202897 [Emiliania huxleyi CCMP1516]|eukprot:XP_005784669.1 hypothetical protein EMIHUDRAFT_202897 [Emiliania huxleyi CCMP1516]